MGSPTFAPAGAVSADAQIDENFDWKSLADLGIQDAGALLNALTIKKLDDIQGQNYPYSSYPAGYPGSLYNPYNAAQSPQQQNSGNSMMLILIVVVLFFLFK